MSRKTLPLACTVRYLCISRHVGHGQVQAETLIDGLTEKRELTS
jgi:hypothetical protein